MKGFLSAVATFFSGVFNFLRNAWIKHSPAMFRGLNRFATFVWKQASRFTSFVWSYFVARTIDVRIAIVISTITLYSLMFGTLHWFVILCFVASWAVVLREKYTLPLIAWCLDVSKPARKAFGEFLGKILFFGYGIPIAMIGWGVINFIAFILFFYISQGIASFFGMMGFGGVIFGAFFYAIELHSKTKTKTP